MHSSLVSLKHVSLYFPCLCFSQTDRISCLGALTGGGGGGGVVTVATKRVTPGLARHKQGGGVDGEVVRKLWIRDVVEGGGGGRSEGGVSGSTLREILLLFSEQGKAETKEAVF